jgi:hypothetical protein
MRTLVLLTLLTTATLAPAQDKKKAPAKSAEPKVVVVLPLGMAPGKTRKLTIRGMNLEGAKEVRFDGGAEAKIESTGKAPVPDKNPERVGDTQIVVTVKLKSDTGGDLSFVVVTAAGESKPHPLLVDAKTPIVKEKEPNDGFRAAQKVTLPVIVEGTIDRAKDVDVFRFAGKQGQTLSAEVFADRHGSALDGQLTLYRGNALQVAHGAVAKGRDPRIEVVLPADDDYFLVLVDANDTGSAIHAYRLAIAIKAETKNEIK